MTDVRSNGGANSTATTGGRPMNWIERKPPAKFEFGAGAELAGVLLNHERRTVRDKQTGQVKPVNRYTVQELETGEAVFFHGTTQLDDALRPTDVGHFVRIVCKGDDAAAGRNGHPMKLFQVFVTDNMAPGWAMDGTRITDDDLPPAEEF